jgi:N4-gp56 family major capsid protein
MTRKRTLHNLRVVAKRRQSEWWARVFDELLFMYLSGARGTNADYIYPLTYTGFANNALSAPDAEHILYGDGTTKATLTTAGKMTLAVVDRLVAKATMMGGGVTGTPQIQPIMVDGEEHFVICMSPWNAYDLRTATGATNWLEIQKAAATNLGKASPIFKGGMGMHNNVVLHEHKAVIRFTDYGAGANVLASRSLFLGEQAAVIAFGSPGTNLRYDWHEETRDNGDQVVITTSSIFGIKKCTFNSKDYGVVAVDTAAADPG